MSDRRIEKLEERLNSSEKELAALTSQMHSIRDDLSRRIVDINSNLKEDAERVRVDLRERINDLKSDIKDDFSQVSDSLDELGNNISSVNESLQNLYITQKGSNVKVQGNEKIIWGILTVLVTGALYVIQDLIKASGAG